MKIVLLVLLMSSCFKSYKLVAIEQQAPNFVLKAAQDGINSFLDKMPSYIYKQEKKLEIAKPYLLYTIFPENIRSYTGNQEISDLVKPTSLWYFPIISDETIFAMLVVEQNSETMARAVSFGYFRLVDQLNKCLEQFPQIRENEHILIAIYQIKEFFIASPTYNPYAMIALQKEPMQENSLPYEINRILPQINIIYNEREDYYEE